MANLIFKVQRPKLPSCIAAISQDVVDRRQLFTASAFTKCAGERTDNNAKQRLKGCARSAIQDRPSQPTELETL